MPAVVPPPVPAVFAVLDWSVSDGSTELAPPVVPDVSGSAERSLATPSGVKPVDDVPASGSTPGVEFSGASMEAFGSDSTSTSRASPHVSPVSAFRFERATEYAGYCDTAPLTSERTSNSTTAAATRVSGAPLHRRCRVGCGGWNGARKCCHAATARARTVSPSRIVANPLPAMDGGLSNHGTP